MDWECLFIKKKKKQLQKQSKQSRRKYQSAFNLSWGRVATNMASNSMKHLLWRSPEPGRLETAFTDRVVDIVQGYVIKGLTVVCSNAPFWSLELPWWEFKQLQCCHVRKSIWKHLGDSSCWTQLSSHPPRLQTCGWHHLGSSQSASWWAPNDYCEYQVEQKNHQLGLPKSTTYKTW